MKINNVDIPYNKTIQYAFDISMKFRGVTYIHMLMAMLRNIYVIML